jgi:GH35 family endo-1,4-beta-xylanase
MGNKRWLINNFDG